MKLETPFPPHPVRGAHRFHARNGVVPLAIAGVLLAALDRTQATTAYDFLTVTPLNATSSRFNSLHLNGYIDVTHVFSAGGAGTLDNVNSAIFPSQFPVNFPGTGQVQGNLAMTVYNHTSTVTFDLTTYTGLSSQTVFGVWNMTDEIAQPAYTMQLLDANSNLVAPIGLTQFGVNEDNVSQVLGRSTLNLNTTTGAFTTGPVINAGGVHSDAAFWYNIPAGTQQIIITGHLDPLNDIGDGVGYYFAEPAPEASTWAATGAVALMAGIASKRVRRRQ